MGKEEIMVKKNLLRSLSVVMACMMAVMTVACGKNTAVVEDAYAATSEVVETKEEQDLEKALLANASAGSSEETGKVETVYVTANASGAVNDVIVSEWLKNAGADSEIADKTELKDIVNVKGKESFTDNGDGTLTWNADGSDIYYQGTTDKELPVDIKITYTLDGKEISPEELAGKSGNVTIRFEYDNKAKQTVDVDGKEIEVYTPFAMVSGMMLDAGKFANVKVSNGKVISDGGNYVVMGVALPGLKESLNISDEKWDELENGDDLETKLSNSFEISAFTTDFELGMTITMASSDILSDFGLSDLSDSDKIEDLKDDMGQLSDGSTKLVDGSKELKDGTTKLSDGSNQLFDGSKKLYDGTVELYDGTTQLANGSAELSNGSAQLYNGTTQLASGANQLHGGTSKLSSGTQTLADGAGKLYDGSKTLYDGVVSYTDGAAKVNQGAGQLASGTKQLKSGSETLVSSLATAESGAGSLAEGAKAVSEGTTLLANTLTQKMDEMNGGLSQKRACLSAARAYLTDEAEWNEAAAAGFNMVKEGLTKDMIDQLKAGYQMTVAGANNAADMVGGLQSKLQETSVSMEENYGENDAEAEGGEVIKEDVADVENVENSDNNDEVNSSDVNNEAGNDASDSSQYSGSESFGSYDEYQEYLALKAQIETLQQKQSELEAKAQELQTAKATLEQQAAVLEAGKTELEKKAQELQAGKETLEKKAKELQAGKEKLEKYAPLLTMLQSEETMSALSGLSQLPAGVDAAKQYGQLLGALDAAIASIDQTVGTMSSMSSQFGAIGELTKGASQLYQGSVSLADGITKIHAGAATLDAGIGQVNTGASTLAAGSSELVSNNEKLRNGAKDLTSGAGQLSNGAVELKNGASELDAGAAKLADGVGQVNDGAAKLSSGASQLSDGAVKLSNGANELKNGAKDLSDGAGQLNDGITELDNGVSKLLDGVKKLDEEGIQKLYEAFDGDLTEFADKLTAIQKAGSSYTSFAGSNDAENSSVKFIIKTAGVKAKDI